MGNGVKPAGTQALEELGVAELVKDIADFILDFNRLPTSAEVIDWAEDNYEADIDNDTTQRLISRGKREAGWTQ